MHVAIIMDGNGRWAESRGLPRCAGHSAGVDAIRRATEAALARGVAWLSLFAFSRENWRRDDREVAHLFRLLERYAREEVPRLVRQGVRLRFLGGVDELPPATREAIAAAEAATAGGAR